MATAKSVRGAAVRGTVGLARAAVVWAVAAVEVVGREGGMAVARADGVVERAVVSVVVAAAMAMA